MKNIILTIVLLSVVTGCAHKGKENAEDSKRKNIAMMDTWIGAPVDAVVKKIGYPDSQFLAPSGNMVYVYSYSHSKTSPVTARTYRYDYIPDTTLYSGGETDTYWCKMYFEIGQDKKILRWSAKGNWCF